MTDTGMERKKQISLKVLEARSEDIGHKIARISLENMSRIGAAVGDIICISGKKETAAKILPAFQKSGEKMTIQINAIIRENAGAGIDDRVSVRKASYSKARFVSLSPSIQDIGMNRKWDIEHIGRLLEGYPIVEGDRVRVPFLGSKALDFNVKKTSPEGVVILHSGTSFEVSDPAIGQYDGCGITYEDIGGLHMEIQKVREIVEFPLRFPQLFDRLGISPPNGVLLYGPPGTGKTLIARAVATEAHACFLSVNGPEIVHKFYGESEANLRNIFEQAASKAPAIIFIDEIDAIAPRRKEVTGEVEKRVVGQLLVLMDGIEKRKNVVVIGATNIPDVLDPALRRPGRFDREISINAPDKDGRVEILKIHAKNMPLNKDVDLTELGEMTYGFVGADLEALCREAGMNALKEILIKIDSDSDTMSEEFLNAIEVDMNHFMHAMREVEPSAIREVFVEIPNTRWEDIGGLYEIKDALKKAIEWPLKYKAFFDHVKAARPKGILLAGPPGTGKTLIAKAVASESNANFISIKGPALFSKWVGESEKRIREVFKKAKQAAPCIVFFDEIDALSNERASDSGVGQRVISQLLTELDGIEELKGVVVLAATNRMDLVDPALLRQGRFDHIFKVSEPNEEEKCDIFTIHLRGRPIAEDVRITELVRNTDGFVGSDISGVCDKAAIKSIERFIAGKNKFVKHLVIQAEDFKWAINEVIRIKEAVRTDRDGATLPVNNN